MTPRHHKSDEQVEGAPDSGHGRGVPRRPDAARLDERSREDRREAGLPVGKWEDTETPYEDERAEVDREED
ncbi:hypothetical protein AB0L59_28780 [Streptomyces sp. NPDC052109]|uniref:hypothetical protein n=1 Tax=Streptomyces sp. NPDC052109 TaxID=3155527 RepID=UPI00343CFF0E